MKQTLILLLFCCCLSASAQTPPPPATGIIKGIVADSTTGDLLGYVTVFVKEAGKEQPLKSGFTSDKGAFELGGLPLSNYQVIITYLGYKRKVIEVPALTTSAPTLDLGKVLLTATTNTLKEVQVTAEKPLVTQDVDKLSYHVDADPESQTISALDMLRKVPLLSVDAEDNIQLNGSGSYRILINGKTSSLFARNPKDVFKSMPASAIKSIEVITNPSSKYEAEGVGGIINIITHRKSIGGYNGAVNLGVRDPAGMNAGGYITAKVGRFGFSGNIGMSSSTSPVSRNYSLRMDKLLSNEIEQVGTRQGSSGFYFLSGELSFELDSLNLLTASYNFNTSKGENNGLQQVQQFNRVQELTQSFERISDGSHAWGGSDFGADYQRTFKKSKDQLLTLSYRLSTNENGNDTDFRTLPILNYRADAYTTDNQGSFREQTLQADYVQPFGKHAFEAGLKGIFRLNSSDYFYKRVINPDLGTFELVPNLSNNFEYTQDIYAAYTAFNLKKDKWGLKAGGRLEETRVDADFSSSRTFAKQDYFNLIPNVILSRTLKGTTTVRLSYTQRIERPSLYYINPYVNAIDTFNISYGNPDLKPATANVFTLAYSTFVKGASVNASLFHHFTNSSIQRYTVLGEDSIARTTYANIGRDRTYGISLYGNTTLFKKLTLNMNGSLNYVQLSSFINGEPQNNSGVRANVSGSANYRFEKNWRIGGNLGYNSPSILLQGRSASFIFNSFSLSKQFLKGNKATLSASIFSPFQKERYYFNEVEGPNFTQLSESYYQNRRLNLSFSYRFGKLKEGIARKKRGIKNDDLAEGGDEQSGGN